MAQLTFFAGHWRACRHLRPASAALADDCARYNPDAVQADASANPDDEWVISMYGSVCVLRDEDRGQADYYTRSESTCKSMPGMLEWSKDRGAGHNTCIFSPAGSDQSGGEDSCTYAKDGACDEPGLCPSGTDTSDCSGLSSGLAATGSGPDACGWANDGTCDEPGLCPSGTDTSDCSGLSPGLGSPLSPPSAAADPGNFEVKICNRTGWDISLAVAMRESPTFDDVTIQGWWILSPGQCESWGRSLGDYSNAYVYYYGYAGNRSWGGGQAYCIPYRRYERYNTANYTCQGDEELLGFERMEVTQGVNTLELTP